MYDTKTRVGLVKRQVREKKLRHEKHVLRGLSFLCLFLCISLMGTIGAFTAAVLITVLCIRCRKGIKRNIRIKKRHTKEGMRQ